MEGTLPPLLLLLIYCMERIDVGSHLLPRLFQSVIWPMHHVQLLWTLLGAQAPAQNQSALHHWDTISYSGTVL